MPRHRDLHDLVAAHFLFAHRGHHLSYSLPTVERSAVPRSYPHSTVFQGESQDNLPNYLFLAGTHSFPLLHLTNGTGTFTTASRAAWSSTMSAWAKSRCTTSA